METNEREEEPVDYREEVLRLIAEGKIKHTTKYVEKTSDETLESIKIYKAYVTKQLDETNEQITKTLIDQLSELLSSLEMVEKKEELKDDLRDNELFKRDVRNILSYVTPYVPWIGLACGAICLGKHVLKTRASREVATQTVKREEEGKQKEQ